MKKLKFPTKQNLAKPVEVDEMRPVSLFVGFQDGVFRVDVAMFDDGEPVVDDNGETRERPIHIGLASVPAMGLDVDKLLDDILKVIQNCGVLPAGGTIEED